MCITTSDELQFVLDRLKTSCSGKFGIGLSRQAGLRSDVDANWKCEGDGTTLDTQMTPWANGNPSKSDDDAAGTRIMSDSATLRDINPLKPFAQSNDGYICEYDLVVVTSLPGDVTLDTKMTPWTNDNPSRSDDDDAGIRIISTTAASVKDIDDLKPFAQSNDGYIICEYVR
ncbi:uncharacterized protein [Antedon mediterranea]|uniref:uncharacterized protein n=1 Tax=Antedon mediterranea TaxID=105859 RepID=UPI003AF86C32